MVDSGPAASDSHTAENAATAFGADASPWGSETPLFGEPSAESDQPQTTSAPASPFAPRSPFSAPAASAFTTVDRFEPGDLGTEDVFDTSGAFALEEAEGPGKAPPAQFSFDEGDGAWAEQRLQAVSRKSAPAFSTAQNPTAVKTQEYFQYIPADVMAKEGGASRQGILMLVGIAVLAVLNLISFGYLLSSL
jgi:hypothetical protein